MPEDCEKCRQANEIINRQNATIQKQYAALKIIAEYDGESIWNDDRDDAANAMLDIAREAIK